MNKPNIFSIATKELSQDAFITWLIQWADKSCCEYDEQLNEIGRKFISFLLDGKISIDENLINHVEAGRQWDKKAVTQKNATALFITQIAFLYQNDFPLFFCPDNLLPSYICTNKYRFPTAAEYM